MQLQGTYSDIYKIIKIKVKHNLVPILYVIYTRICSGKKLKTHFNIRKNAIYKIANPPISAFIAATQNIQNSQNINVDKSMS